jgi:hypothetical protein
VFASAINSPGSPLQPNPTYSRHHRRLQHQHARLGPQEGASAARARQLEVVQAQSATPPRASSPATRRTRGYGARSIHWRRQRARAPPGAPAAGGVVGLGKFWGAPRRAVSAAWRCTAWRWGCDGVEGWVLWRASPFAGRRLRSEPMHTVIGVVLCCVLSRTAAGIGGTLRPCAMMCSQTACAAATAPCHARNAHRNPGRHPATRGRRQQPSTAFQSTHASRHQLMPAHDVSVFPKSELQLAHAASSTTTCGQPAATTHTRQPRDHSSISTPCSPSAPLLSTPQVDNAPPVPSARLQHCKDSTSRSHHRSTLFALPRAPPLVNGPPAVAGSSCHQHQHQHQTSPSLAWQSHIPSR